MLSDNRHVLLSKQMLPAELNKCSVGMLKAGGDRSYCAVLLHTGNLASLSHHQRSPDLIVLMETVQLEICPVQYLDVKNALLSSFSHGVKNSKSSFFYPTTHAVLLTLSELNA